MKQADHLPLFLLALAVATLINPVAAQTQGAAIWSKLSRDKADCSIPGISTSFGKHKDSKVDWIRQIDDCVVNSSLIRTARGARGQFITVTDFKEGGVEGYLSYLYEVDCDSMASRKRYFWNLSKKKYKANQEMYFDTESKWWYFFRDDAWEEWKPIESIHLEDQFLCSSRNKLSTY